MNVISQIFFFQEVELFTVQVLLSLIFEYPSIFFFSQDLTMDGFPEKVDPAMESPGAMTTPTPREAHVLVGVTGSVAALKLPLLVSGLLQIPGVSVHKQYPC